MSRVLNENDENACWLEVAVPSTDIWFGKYGGTIVKPQ
jgi:hypothetical protein